MIVWFTGLPCSGKTTIANKVSEKLDNMMDMFMSACQVAVSPKKLVELLDGDIMRESHFARGLGFSKEERHLHLLRIGYLAEKMNEHVPFVLCTFITPYEDTRKVMPYDILIHVDASQEKCAERDVKGMWARAKAGEIKGFTGYDDPYERPTTADLVLNTEELSVDECADKVINSMIERHNEKNKIT